MPGRREKLNIKILLASMKTLINFKDWSGSRVIISLPASLSVIGQFSPVSSRDWIQEKSADLHVLGGLGYMDFQNHRRFPVSIFMVKIAASEPLKSVTVKDF
jgi:hypothetical protein